MPLPGDHIAVETPVPIPNTVVKHCEPMIVPTSVKVGIAGICLRKENPGCQSPGFFLALRTLASWNGTDLVARQIGFEKRVLEPFRPQCLLQARP